MKKKILSAAALLRQKAEEQLKTQGEAAPLLDIETLRLIHELEVHQIELEMQNDELLMAKYRAEDASQKFSDLYDFGPSGYLSLSREGIIIELNFNTAGLLGTDRSHLKNKRFAQFVSRETRPAYTLFLETILESKGRQTCEIILESNGDQPTYVYLKGTYVEADDKCLVTMFDITERKKAEVTLKASEENLNEAQHIAKIGSWVWDIPNNRILWSDELMNINGHDKSKPIPPFEKLEPFYTPESWKLLAETVENSVATGEPYELELEIVLPNGKHVFTISRGKVVKDADGKVVKMHGTVQDITERKKAEEIQKANEARYSALFNSSPMPMAINNEHLQITYLNSAFIQMFGYTLDDIPTLDQWFPKAYPNKEYRNIIAEAWLLELTRVIESGGAFVPLEANITCKNGSIRTAMVSATPFSSDFEGEYLIVFQDITERKQAEEKLKASESNLMRGEDIAKIGYWTLNLNDKMFTASLGALKIYGFETTNVSREDVVNLRLPEYNLKMDEALNALLYEGKPYAIEYKIKRRNTEEIVDIYAKAEYNRDSNLLFGTIQDITDRKQAEAELHDIIEKNPMSIQIVNLEGYTLQVNTAHYDLFGSAPPSTFSIFEDLQQKGYGDYISQAKNGEVVHLPDIFYNPHDVSPDLPDMPRWIRALIFPLNDSAGKPERYVFMHENITERKQSEELLAKSYKQYHELSDSITDVFFALDKDLRYTYWNKACETLTGVTAENAIGKSLLDIFPDNPERQQVEKLVCNVNETKTQKQIVVNYPGNNAYVHEITAYPGDGGVSVFVKDITERKRAEQQLQQASENWSKTFDAIQDGIILLDQNQHILASNDAFLKFVGKTKEQVIGTHCYEMVHGTNCPHVNCPYSKLALSKKRETTEMDLNGIICQVMVDPIVDSENNILGAVHIVTDISQRKKAEQAVQDKIAELQRFFDVTIGRELKMIELKQEINQLARQLGEEEDRYIIVD